MISTTTTKATYTGNASTVTPYVVPFPLANDSALVLVETDEDGNSATLDPGDYVFTPTKDINGRITGGSIVTDPAIPATSTLEISRVTPKTQTLDFQVGGSFQPEALESALDRIIMILQEEARDRGEDDTALQIQIDDIEQRVTAIENA